MKACGAMLAAGLALALPAGRAAAFTVGSAATEPCHERITAAAYRRVLAGTHFGGAVMNDVAGAISTQYAYVVPMPSDPQARGVLLALLVGARHPDTHGHSILALEDLRLVHASAEGQDAHALRAIDQDGPGGDEPAVAATRAEILELARRARAAAARPADQQLATVTIYDDFYGEIEVEVWEPAFLAACAAHALQDSFTHSLRSADLHRVIHVMNYAEAILGGHDPARDGLAHSDSMDACGDPDVAPLVDAATRATEDLLAAILIDGDDATVIAVLDTWLTYEAGCDDSNAYCGSPWVKIARKQQTGPYIGCEVAAGRRHGTETPLLMAVMVATLGLWRRRVLTLRSTH